MDDITFPAGRPTQFDCPDNGRELLDRASHRLTPIRRLVLCLDGTWNRADDKEITNIVHIRDLVEPKIETTACPPEYQQVFYHTGVGTGISKTSNIFDGATGRGLGRNVRNVYKYLSQHYREGIEIYIFGFSRGAFTARSLVAYVAASCLLKPEHCSPENEQRAWQYYKSDPCDRHPSEYEALRKLSYDPEKLRIRVLGVFDTVGALGVPVEFFRSWNRWRFQFHDVTLSTSVDYGFHALAIDEKRGPFRASLWQYPNHRHFKRVEQVWFPGAHGHIGGGYKDAGLSSRSLFWMLSRIENEKIGLKFVDGWRSRIVPNMRSPLCDSRTPLYWGSRVRPMVRVINQNTPQLGLLSRLSRLPPHAIPLGEMLSTGALYRWKEMPDYRPHNLRAALDRTFTHDQPRPIPIVRDDGVPLDWVRNDDHQGQLESVLPDDYKRAFRETVKWYAARPDLDTSMFSTPYQAPGPTNY
jgi:hypothetical protein